MAGMSAHSEPLPPPPEALGVPAAAAPAEPEADMPWEPISLADVAELAIGSGVAESELPAPTRAALEARRAAQEPASDTETGTDTLATLKRLLRAAEASGDVGPALKALEMLERRAGAGADHRTARELSRAELQRIARGES